MPVIFLAIALKPETGSAGLRYVGLHVYLQHHDRYEHIHAREGISTNARGWDFFPTEWPNGSENFEFKKTKTISVKHINVQSHRNVASISPLCKPAACMM